MLGFLSALIAWSVVYSEWLAAASESAEWAQFLGRFHPVVLHLPIGLFFGLFAIELVAWRQRNTAVDRCALLLVWLLALSTTATASFGLLLASNGDYSGSTYDWHKWLGIAFAAAALPVTFLKVLSVYSAKMRWCYRTLLFGLLVLLPVVGHNGGNLTHGTGYLTEYAPDWLNALSAADEDEANADTLLQGNLFTEEIQPILNRYCVECHGPEKQKSRYRMDTYAYLLTPGSIGDPTLEPGSMSQSMLLQYMLLPESDEMAMPPEGKPRPSAEEILLIAHWIASGAEGPPVDEAARAAERAALEAERAELEALFELGVILLPIGKDTDLLYLDLQNVDGVLTNEVLQVLSTYKDRIQELRLSGYSEAITLLQALEGAAELRHMNLSRLNSADLAVNYLNSFAGLKTLNLFGSDISDTGLSRLDLPVLSSLYLGSTQVSPLAVAAFSEAKPGVEVVGDVDLSLIEAIQAADTANSAEFQPDKK